MDGQQIQPISIVASKNQRQLTLVLAVAVIQGQKQKQHNTALHPITPTHRSNGRKSAHQHLILVGDNLLVVMVVVVVMITLTKDQMVEHIVQDRVLLIVEELGALVIVQQIETIMFMKAKKIGNFTLKKAPLFK